MIKKVDYIIVGQGLGGTLLCHFLESRGKSFICIDNSHHQAASKIAAGVINPITGRKYIKSWRIEDFLPFAKKTYDELERKLGIEFFHEKLIYRGLYSVKDENTWEARKGDSIAGQYIVESPDTSQYDRRIEGVLSYGALQGGGHTQLGKLIESYQKYLQDKEFLMTEKFQYSNLEIKGSNVEYKQVSANRILFAEGYQVKDNPWFNHLGHEPAKGEVLIVKIKDRPFDAILRHKFFISPIDDEHYWVGSGYTWDYEDDKPTSAWYSRLKNTLDEILKVDYEVVNHIAGIRPCVRGRRPMLGASEVSDRLVLFNGLGTKGASLGPYWANHLIEHLEDGKAIDPEVLI